MFTNLNLDDSLMKQIQGILDNKNAENLPKPFIESAKKAAEDCKTCICAEERTAILRANFKEAEKQYDGEINESIISAYHNYFTSITTSS